FQYAYADPYFGGLYTAYAPHKMVSPQVMVAAPGRIPLPAADILEDGPIYVNAKQYHGILRRRQIRAKLEAQNKLVKNRK
ncbi:Nuclear transcription factor Y subunit A-3, partial [Striga hermonthica]